MQTPNLDEALEILRNAQEAITQDAEQLYDQVDALYAKASPWEKMLFPSIYEGLEVSGYVRDD